MVGQKQTRVRRSERNRSDPRRRCRGLRDVEKPFTASCHRVGGPPDRSDDFSSSDRSLLRTAVYEQTTITFGIRGPLARSDLPGLCDRVCTLLERSHATVALCDVSGIAADAVAVDALARLQLAAYRHGCQVRLRECTPALRDLVAFMGLADVLVE